MDEYQKKSNILSYWRAIEFFLPQKIPEFNPNNLREPVFKIAENDIAPWNKQHKVFTQLVCKKQQKICHVVYGGIYPIAIMRKNMQATFGKDPDVFDERGEGNTCLFSIQLSHEGRPLFESFVLSMCGWALGQLKEPGPKEKNWLDGFEEKMVSLKMSFEQDFAVQDDDEEGTLLKSKNFNVGRVATVADFLKYIEKIQKILKLEQLDISLKHFFVKSFAIHEKNELKVDESDFLNSFFVKDLNKVSSEIAKGNISIALSQYLEENSQDQLRIDVRKQDYKEKLLNLEPDFYPRGCWPSQGFFPLVYAQQFAVNTIRKNFRKQAGVFSINGPPGTGKTTLLRDLIASVIVERAIKLSELSDPSAAFLGEEQWKSDSYTHTIRTWKEEFYGFEMVVASSNNSAVENVTLEIPALDAIDPRCINEVSCFADIATNIMDKNCWALLAAKLGNKSNRMQFKNKFWAYPEFYSKTGKEDSDEPKIKSFYQYLSNCQPSTTIIEWGMAVQQFKIALEAEDKVRQARQALYEKYKIFVQVNEDILVLDANIEKIENDIVGYHEEMINIELFLVEKNEQREKINKRRREYQAFKPRGLASFFQCGKAYQDWRKGDLDYQQQIFDIEKVVDVASDKISHLKNKIAAIKKEVHRLEKAKKDWLKNQADVLIGKEILGKYFPDISVLQDEIACELSSPWMDEEWFEARVKVFLAALNLHRAFIAVNSKSFLQNLSGAMDILSGKAQKTAPTNAMRSAWATLFFVVPVVSTTFASFDRLFPQLGVGSLGWLFIDEAGQATPQAAVGALWRSKYAVVVGDPLQLQPILTIPITAQEALRKYFCINEIWLPERCSVQVLSDRVNKYGTYLKKVTSENLWVGAPLRVHRRCENPMFDISNHIAYDGMMVFGTPSRSELSIARSCWLHVKGESADGGHWIQSEGDKVKKMVETLLAGGVDEDNIAIISPFSVVAKQLFYMFRPRTPKLKIGTIHRMQGKEANVVILVLGGNPNKPGAKDWASEKPNLLNVAVSRSKMRLYVVGDRELWSTKPYFSQLSESL